MRWLPLAVALALAPCNSAAAQAPESTLPAAPNVDLLLLEDDRHGRLTVPVMIGDSGPYQFLVDTGAQATVLSRDLADSLGLFDRRTATLIGMVSQVTTQTIAIARLGVGRRQAHVPRVPLVEPRNLGGADGVLGVDALQDQRIVFDFARRSMTIASAKEVRPESGYEIVVRARPRHGHLIITDARIGGVRTTIVIDTGAQVSVGNEALAQRLERRASGTSKPAQLHDINGATAQGRLHVVDQAEIGRLQLRNLQILFSPSPAFKALDLESRPAMILGMSELRLFPRVAIDFRTRHILFDVPTSEQEMEEAWARAGSP